MARSKSKTKKRTWIRYLIMILFGGSSGLGGWQFKDHPALRGVYRIVTGREPTEESLTVKSAIRDVAQVLQREDAYQKAGDFEVVIASLELDEAGFRKGQTVDVQVRLIKKGTGITIVWDSKNLGEKPLKVGPNELKIDWRDNPITVSWKPGDSFVFEVWDRRRLFSRKLMEWSAEGDKTFPLQSGDYILSAVDGESSANPKHNRIVLESKPKADSAASVATGRADTIKIR